MTRTTTLHTAALADNQAGPTEAMGADPSLSGASARLRARTRKTPLRTHLRPKRRGIMGAFGALLGCALLAWLWLPGGVTGLFAELGGAPGFGAVLGESRSSLHLPTGMPQWPERAESFLRFLATAFALYWFVRRDIREAEARTNKRIDDAKTELGTRIGDTDKRIDDLRTETHRGFDRLENLLLRLVGTQSKPE